MKPQHKEQIDAEIDRLTAEWLKHLPEKITTTLDTAMYSLLGLSKSWSDKIEIDHCNGRRGALIEVIEKRARDAIDDTVSPLINKALEALKTDKKGALSAIVKEAASKYKEFFQEEVFRIVKDRAKIDAEKYVEALLTNDLTPLLQENQDPSDPKSYPTRLGEVVLGEIAERIATAQLGWVRERIWNKVTIK